MLIVENCLHIGILVLSYLFIELNVLSDLLLYLRLLLNLRFPRGILYSYVRCDLLGVHWFNAPIALLSHLFQRLHRATPSKELPLFSLCNFEVALVVSVEG